MTEPWRRQLWSYRAAQATPISLAQAIADEVHRIEAYYHQNLESEEAALGRSVPWLIDRLQTSTRRALESLSLSAFFAAAKELERAKAHLRELDRVVDIQRFQEIVAARCSEVFDSLVSERLRRLRTGEMLKRLPDSGRALLDQGDYLGARFIARSCDLFVRRLTARCLDSREKKLLQARVAALTVGDLEAEVGEILHGFLSENRLYLTAQIVGDLEVWLTLESGDAELRSKIQQLQRTSDRARKVTREIWQSFPPQLSDNPEEVLSNGHFDS